MVYKIRVPKYIAGKCNKHLGQKLWPEITEKVILWFDTKYEQPEWHIQAGVEEIHTPKQYFSEVKTISVFSDMHALCDLGAIFSFFVGHHLDLISSKCELSLPNFTGTVKKMVSTLQFPITPVSLKKVPAALRTCL